MNLITFKFVSEKWDSLDALTETICQQYWQMDEKNQFIFKVLDLAEKYQLRQHDVTRIIEKYGQVSVKEEYCEICGQSNIYINRSQFARLGIKKQSHKGSLFCTAIELKERMAREKVERKHEEEKRQKHFDFLHAREPVEIERLGYENAIYLYALLSEFYQKKENKILGIDASYPPFTESKLFSTAIIKELYELAVLTPFHMDDLEKLYLSIREQNIFRPPTEHQNILCCQWRLNLNIVDIDEVCSALRRLYLDKLTFPPS